MAVIREKVATCDPIWSALRDQAESRKPPLTLLRRGWGLARAEPELVRRWTAQGCRALPVAEAERSIRALVIRPS